ncbi:MAG: class I SAM-dependent methyltransferase [Synergistaceae bacterium]|nr:class I SAM-dependent methyltransferase [Synergistaceae bacterium]
MKENYYAQGLNGKRLWEVYDTAIPRISRYLEQEIAFVRGNLKKNDIVLELAAGYGRIMREIAPFVNSITGIDISSSNISFGEEYLKDNKNTALLTMDVHDIDFSNCFDAALCLQNGLSAVKAAVPEIFTAKVLKSLKKGGKAYFSTYHPNFWEERIAWFQEQSSKGLLGELDMEKTKDGVIICKDGFRATTPSISDLEKIGRSSGYCWQIFEVDDSSIFLVIEKE